MAEHPLRIRLQARKMLERPDGLEDSHATARHGAAAVSTGLAQQFRFKREINDIGNP